MKMSEEKKTEEKKVAQKQMDAIQMERMRRITDLLSDFLGRKFGFEFELHEEELDPTGMPESALFSVYDRKIERYVDAQPLIAKLPDWLRPFAKARLIAGGNMLFLWWTPKIQKVYEGVTEDLAKMPPAPEPEPDTDEDEDEEPGEGGA